MLFKLSWPFFGLILPIPSSVVKNNIVHFLINLLLNL